MADRVREAVGARRGLTEHRRPPDSHPQVRPGEHSHDQYRGHDSEDHDEQERPERLDLWVVLRYAVPIIIMFVMFSLLYVFVPCCSIRFKEALPGSIFSTAGWIIISLLFSFYVSNFANYTRVYGSIGGVIILLIWIYISCIIILLGGEINATFSYFRSNKKLDKYENQNILPSWIRKRLRKHS
jgi:uncharacterized protein YqhQ